MKPAASIAAVLFSVAAIAHLFRIVLQIEVTAGGAVVPMWVSAIGQFHCSLRRKVSGTGSKADWDEIAGDAPRYDEAPPPYRRP